MGWKYTDARDEGQRYKIGRYILEMGRCVVGREWGDELEGRDLDSDEGKEMGSTSRPSTSGGSGRSSEEGPCGSVMAALRIKRERREKLEREGRIEFDSEDESEQEDLFEGVWDEAVVRLRRAKQKVREENRRRGVMRRGTAP